MISNLLNKQLESQIISRKSTKENSMFSFLTNFNSALINSPTITINPSLQLISRITTKGKIKFCNADFCTATKANTSEIQNTQISNTFHPEMPKVILDVIKKNLDLNIDALAVIKHIDSTGNTIWLNSHFSPNVSSNKLNIACYIKSNPSSKSAINKVEKIYNTIFLLENHVSYDIAKKYFEGLLEMEYGNYEGFIISLFQ